METLFFLPIGLAIAATFVTVEGPMDALLGEPEFEMHEMQNMFDSGRAPNVVVATDGTVLATWGTGHFQVRRSEDGGKTWGEPITIAKPGSQGGMTVDETSGDILAFTATNRFLYRSTDHGRTWEIQDTVVHADKNGNIPEMPMAEHGVTLRHGQHKGRLLRTARWIAGSDEPTNWPRHYNTAVYSDDGGKTWHTSTPFPAMGTGEGTLTELSDGRIYYNSRRHWTPKGINPYMRWTAWSYDGGATWEDLSMSRILPDGSLDGFGGCHAGLARLPVRGRDILLYSNCDSPAGRKDMTVWASFDGGKTWPVKRQVFQGPSAYSSITAGRPGTPSEGWFYILFEGGQSHRYEGGYLAQFNLNWLLEGEKIGDGELPTWIEQTISAEVTLPPGGKEVEAEEIDASTMVGMDGAEMVLIPAGEFLMGSPEDEGEDGEHPQHTVFVDAFYMDKYEVTNGQYKQFIDATGHKAPEYWDNEAYNQPNQPVVGVSWDDAKAYCQWAGKRLPTEAEWEKAARGGSVGKKYPWGDSITHDDANYYGTGGRDTWNRPSPVGSFAPNGYGLYDMAGNVWEWCADWFDSGYYAKSSKQNPTGPSSQEYLDADQKKGWRQRVLRGGSWPNSPYYLRTAYRFSFNPAYGDYFFVGFRCVVAAQD